MATERVERRLATILAANAVGYSRLMGADEEGTHAALMKLRREVVALAIDKHRGRIVKLTGDGLLAEFASVVDAVRCAVEMQPAITERNEGGPSDRRIEFRIGINVGDIIVEAEDIYGDGVNVAARIEALADAGGVFVSNTVHDQVRDRLPFLEQVIERDPRYGSALVEAASRHFEMHVNGWSESPEESRRKGVELTRRALQVAGDDPNVLSRAAYTLGYFGEEVDIAIGLLDRSLELNPSSARGWQWSGWLGSWAGQPDLAIEHFQTSLRLNPREQRANPFMGIGVAHFFARRFEEARVTLLRSLQEKPNWVPTHRFLASCYAHMGRLDEAQETVKRLRTLTNVVVPGAENWRNPEHRELFLSGLRLAAGEAT